MVRYKVLRAFIPKGEREVCQVGDVVTIDDAARVECLRVRRFIGDAIPDDTDAPNDAPAPADDVPEVEPSAPVVPPLYPSPKGKGKKGDA